MCSSWPAWSIEAAKRISDGDCPERLKRTLTRGPDGLVTVWVQPSLGVALAMRSSVSDRRSTSTSPASPAEWLWAGSPTWGAGLRSVSGGAQFVDVDPEPERGAVVAVVAEESPLRVVAVVEELESAAESESGSAPVSSSAIVVVVDFSGADSAAQSDGWPPISGANASRATTPAAS